MILHHGRVIRMVITQGLYPKFQSFKKATDVTKREESLAWDYAEQDGWKWTRPCPLQAEKCWWPLILKLENKSRGQRSFLRTLYGKCSSKSSAVSSAEML